MTSVEVRHQWHNCEVELKCQGSATLPMITDAYLAMDDSGDCLSLPITGNNGDERMNCLQSGCAHIFARENRAILSGDSFPESFLPGFSADTAQSDINFSRDYKGETPSKQNKRIRYNQSQ